MGRFEEFTDEELMALHNALWTDGYPSPGICTRLDDEIEQVRLDRDVRANLKED